MDLVRRSRRTRANSTSKPNRAIETDPGEPITHVYTHETFVYPIIPVSRHSRLYAARLRCPRTVVRVILKVRAGRERELSTQHFRRKGRNRQNNFVPALPLLVDTSGKKMGKHLYIEYISTSDVN